MKILYYRDARSINKVSILIFMTRLLFEVFSCCHFRIEDLSHVFQVFTRSIGVWAFTFQLYCYFEFSCHHPSMHLSISPIAIQFSFTIWHNIWQFWLFYRFLKIEVRAKKWILGYLFNLIEYFNVEGVDWLPGYILSLIGPFLNFWILRS